jgi:DNA-binding beta-propeller fold protein YncE
VVSTYTRGWHDIRGHPRFPGTREWGTPSAPILAASLFPSPGLAHGRGKLFIADTYNNKIKLCDPNTLAVKTFAGDGKPGSGDESPRFYQPGGLSVAGESLYVADTNNHKIRVIDIQSGAVRTLEIAGLNAPRSEKVSAIQAD